MYHRFLLTWTFDYLFTGALYAGNGVAEFCELYFFRCRFLGGRHFIRIRRAVGTWQWFIDLSDHFVSAADPVSLYRSKEISK